LKTEAEAEEAKKNAEDEQRKKAEVEKKRLEDERMKEVEKKRLEDEQRKKDEDVRAKVAAGCNPVIYQHLQLGCTYSCNSCLFLLLLSKTET
jgi:hypothetical protein